MWLLLPMLCASLVLGIGIGALNGVDYTLFDCALVVWLALSALTLAFAKRPISPLLLFASGYALGVVLVVEPPEAPSVPINVEVTCILVVERTSMRDEGWTVTGRLTGSRAESSDEWDVASARVAVHRSSGGWVPTRGDVVMMRVRFRPVGGALHEFAFDPERHARVSGLDASGTARSELVLVSLGRGPLAEIDRLRVRLERTLVTRLAPREAGVLLAIVTGDKSRLDPELRAAFATNGAAHVLAVSGLHLGILCAGAFAVLRRLAILVPALSGRFGAERSAAVATLPLVVAYVLLTGAAASAVRAGIMASVVLIGVMNDRRASSIHALCAAIFVMLVSNPCWLFDVGFQLSVSATASLILTPARPAHGAIRKLLEGIRISTVASLATAPILLWHFGETPLLSPLTNLVVVPPIAFVALPCALVGSLLDALGLFWGGLLIQLAGASVRLAVAIASGAAPVLEVSLVWGRPAGLGLVGWAWVGLWSPRFGVSRTRETLVSLTFALALIAVDAPVDEDALRVHAIPIGQGDCTLVESGAGRFLVDAGGSVTTHGGTARRAILPYLSGRGVARLDVLVLTHADLDHAGDAAEMVRAMRPGEVWVAAGQSSAAFRRARAAASEVGASWRVLRVPLVRIAGSASIVALPTLGGLGRNDGSLVLRVCERRICALLAGDIGAGREEMLLASGVSLRADYLKVAHHGSRTSSRPDFLDRVRPRVGVIHIGRGNRFGFPHQDVIDALRRRGTRIRRTDSGRAVIWATDGVHTWEEPAYSVWQR